MRPLSLIWSSSRRLLWPIAAVCAPAVRISTASPPHETLGAQRSAAADDGRTVQWREHPALCRLAIHAVRLPAGNPPVQPLRHRTARLAAIPYCVPAQKEYVLPRRGFNRRRLRVDPAVQAQILTRLDQRRTMNVATHRPDDWPRATTVGLAHEGLTLYFLCAPDSQKAANLAQDDRVSLPIDHDPPPVMAITGLSMAAPAHRDSDPHEAEPAAERVLHRFPRSEALCLLRVTPEIPSVLDYAKGFGHTELLRC